MENTHKRFWNKVVKTRSCWLWQAGCTADGYGGFWYEGKTLAAHRFSWMLAHGEDSIPSGLVLDHICRNPKCVNPEHLRPVTNAENISFGIGPSAINKRKTHCKNGHELTEDNVLPYRSGKRICRICMKEFRKNWRLRDPEKLKEERRKANERATAYYKQHRDEINAKRRAARN